MLFDHTLGKLHYCDKKTGNSSSCANIATRRTRFMKNRMLEKGHRCEKHANTKTTKTVIIESLPFDQSEILKEVQKFLHSLIGKNIISKMHTARCLRVKYIKPDTGAVMCFQEHSKQWKFVYYNQITDLLP